MITVNAPLILVIKKLDVFSLLSIVMIITGVRMMIAIEAVDVYTHMSTVMI
jgi:hypothetical protein